MSEQNLIIPEAKRQKTKTLIDVMIDIETQSTKYNASIVAIAAIKFDPFTYIENWTINEIDEKNKIEILIDLEDSKRYNLDIDESTMTWWSRQPESVRKHIFEDCPRVTLREGLDLLNSFVSGSRRYWCQGINFDPIVLESSYRECGVNPKWKFWELRDSRTISKLVKSYELPNKPETSHNALDDCFYQINVVQKVFESLSIKNA